MSKRRLFGRRESPAATAAAQRLLDHARELQVESREAMDRCAAERFALEGRIIAIDHELRTPLASVMGYLELLLDGDFGPLSEEQLEVLGRIQAATHHFEKAVGGFKVEAITAEAGGR